MKSKLKQFTEKILHIYMSTNQLEKLAAFIEEQKQIPCCGHACCCNREV